MRLRSPGVRRHRVSVLVGLSEQHERLVDNRPGVGANLAAEIVSRSAPDGYTALLANAGLATGATAYVKLNFNALRDFAPVTQVSATPHILVIHPSLGRREVELPRTGARESDQLFHRLRRPAAATFTSPMRAIGATGAKRSKVMPNLPTIAEQGVAGYEFGAWFGIYAPAATPAPVIKSLSDSIQKAVRDASLADRFDKEGAEIVGSTPEELAKHVKAELALWAKVVKSAGLRID